MTSSTTSAIPCFRLGTNNEESDRSFARSYSESLFLRQLVVGTRDPVRLICVVFKVTTLLRSYNIMPNKQDAGTQVFTKQKSGENGDDVLSRAQNLKSHHDVVAIIFFLVRSW